MRLWVAVFSFLPVSALAAAETPGERVGPGLEWIDIPAGCFEMGSARGYPEERPVRETCVEEFQMTATEITNSQFSDFVAATGYETRAERGWSATERNGPGVDLPPGGAVFVPPLTRPIAELSWWRFVEGADWRTPLGPEAGREALANEPVVQITRADAEAYADWAGGRLPTEAEWEHAAKAGLDWGDAELREAREKANTWQGIFPVADTGDDGFEGIAPVASYSANAFGLYDMIGNVWEWTSSPYTPSHATGDQERAGSSGLDPTQPGIPVGAVKGGSFLCAMSYCVRFRPAARQAQDLAFSTSHIGFRLVRD